LGVVRDADKGAVALVVDQLAGGPALAPSSKSISSGS